MKPADLFLHKLKILHSAENQFAKALPKMVGVATDSEVKAGLEATLATVKQHIMRLTVIRKDFGIGLKGHTCEETSNLLGQVLALITDEATRGDDHDVALITVAQRIQHSEIAHYGRARSLAADLGLGQAVLLLSETIREKESNEAELRRLTGAAARTGASLEMGQGGAQQILTDFPVWRP
jgi:ferritin-like metal-binding protein YciE